MVMTHISQNREIPYDMKELKNPESGWNTSGGDNSIKGVGKAKLNSLKQAIDEIEELIVGRENLSREIIREGEKIKMEITNFLSENKVKDPNDPVETQERSALRQKKVDVAELQLNERVSCWKDVALLKKEMREKEMELSEKQGRVDILDKILEEQDE